MPQLTGKMRLVGLAVLAAAVLVPVAVAGGAPVLGFGSTPLGAFGSVAKNSTTTRVYTVANSGGSATSVLKVKLSGASDFSIASDACSASSLGPRKSCSVGISFAPTSDGVNDVATLTVSSKKPPAIATLLLTGSTPANPYNLAFADCESDGGTFSTDPASDLMGGSSASFLWSCNGALFLLDSSSPESIDCGLEGGSTFLSGVTYPFNASCYR